MDDASKTTRAKSRATKADPADKRKARVRVRIGAGGRGERRNIAKETGAMHEAHLSTGMLNFDSARSADMAADFPWAWNSWVDVLQEVISVSGSIHRLNPVCLLYPVLEHITFTWLHNTVSCGTIN